MTGTYYTHHNHRGDVVLPAAAPPRLAATNIPPLALCAPRLARTSAGSNSPRRSATPATGWSYYGYRFYAPHWQRWLSPDPIGEAGGVNLYTGVGNNPPGSVDAYGLFAHLIPGVSLFPFGPFVWSGMPCGLRIKNEVWRQFAPGGQTPQTDPSFRYGHCVAHCRIQRECFGGRITSWLGGFGKELQDEFKQWFGRGAGWESGDMKANREGRKRGRHCKEQSCEEACKGVKG